MMILNSLKIGTEENELEAKKRSFRINQGKSTCKPGSVLPKWARRSFICDARHRTPVATYPETRADNTPRKNARFPI